VRRRHDHLDRRSQSLADELLAQEIFDDLEAALEQFRLIAGDLNGGTAGSAV
jgi:hypothetical protein